MEVVNSETERGFDALRSGKALGVIQEVRRLLAEEGALQEEDQETVRLLGDLTDRGVKLVDNLLKKRSERQIAEQSLPLPPASIEGMEVRKAVPLDLSKAVIITKETKVEYEMRTEGRTFEEVEARIRKGGDALCGRLESHSRHIQRKRELEDFFAPEQFVTLSEENREKINNASIAISWGGDDHLSAVAQYVSGKTPVLAINSDPEKSFGALLNHTHDQFRTLVTSLERGEYVFEPWTRLSVELNGKMLSPALGLVMFAEEKRKYLSRNLIKISGRSTQDPEGRETEQKSSGLLISTGVGSTSWYRGAAQYLYPQGDVFPRTSRVARLVLTEPSYTVIRKDGTRGASEVMHGSVFDGEEIEIKSLNKDHGILTIDSIADYTFKAGSEAKVSLSKEPLWIVKVI